MAENGKAEKGEGAAPGEGSGAPAPSVQGATAPRREKPLIEGAAIEVETSTIKTPASEARKVPGHPASTSAETSPEVSGAAPELAPAGALAAPLEPAQTETVANDSAAPEEGASPPPEPPRRRGAGLWPLAAAIVLGAGIAVGVAFGLHYFDKTPKSLAALETRVAALEHGQDTKQETTRSLQAGAAALGKELGALEEEAQVTKTTLAHVQQSIEQLENALKRAPQKGGAAPADLAPLSGRVDKLVEDLASLDRGLQALAAKFAAEMRGVQAEKTAAAQAAMTHAEADALAILAADLRRKVEAGDAFAEDLSALANHGADRAKLAILEPLAASGVATPAALAKQFSAAAPAILATAPEPKAEGFFGRLAQDAAHLVRIRKIGDTKGNDLAAHVARIAAALAAGKLEDALREWNDLPGAAKAKSQAFGEALQQRVAAIAAAKLIEADALAALAKVKS